MSSGSRILKGAFLGALLAGLFWAAHGPPRSGRDIPEIVVSETEVAHQRARWEKMRGRAPTEQELKHAVDGYVRNEILYREALARGMDREDPRVRMAMVQKMEMLAAGQADTQGVSDEDLKAFYALRTERYGIPARLSITHVFFKDGDGARERTQDLLGEFVKNEPTESVLHESGDASLLESSLIAVTALDLEKQFGTDFTAEVLSLSADEWEGPVRSEYGWHAVKVFDRVAGRIPALDEVRGKVEEDLLYEMREAFQEQGFQEIAGKYRVMISDGAEQMLRGTVK